MARKIHKPSMKHCSGTAMRLVRLATDVDAVHAERAAAGVTILQPPADMDFGRCFTAQDPDGPACASFARAETGAPRGSATKNFP